MGTYLTSGEKFISTSTDRSLTVIKLIEPWTKLAWQAEDEAEEAREREQFNAASEEEKKTWYFGYQHPSTYRDASLLHLDSFKTALKELPPTLGEYVEWAKKNLTSSDLLKLGLMVGDRTITERTYTEAMSSIKQAVEFNEHVRVS